MLDSFALSAAPEREGMPMLAANAEGQVLAAYTRFVPETPYSARRAHARLLTAPDEPYPQPEPGPDAGGDPKKSFLTIQIEISTKKNRFKRSRSRIFAKKTRSRRPRSRFPRKKILP